MLKINERAREVQGRVCGVLSMDRGRRVRDAGCSKEQRARLRPQQEQEQGRDQLSGDEAANGAEAEQDPATDRREEGGRGSGAAAGCSC